MSLTYNYIGIDPGAKGAVAIISSTGSITIYDMPEVSLKSLLEIEKPSGNCIVGVESVHPYPGQSCIANFTYGGNFFFAKLLGSCYSEDLKMVTPQKWKGFYQLKREAGETKSSYKHKSIEKAKELFPAVSDLLKASKDGRAEALLIANFIRETYG